MTRNATPLPKLSDEAPPRKTVADGVGVVTVVDPLDEPVELPVPVARMTVVPVDEVVVTVAFGSGKLPFWPYTTPLFSQAASPAVAEDW